MNSNTMSEEQVREFQTMLGEIKTGWGELKPVPGSLRALQDQTTQLQDQMKEVRRLVVARAGLSPRRREAGAVSDECARHLAAQLVAHFHKNDRLGGLCSAPGQRDALVDFTCETLNVSTRTALSTSDIPLPRMKGAAQFFLDTVVAA